MTGMRGSFLAASLALLAAGCGGRPAAESHGHSGMRVVSLAPNITEIVCAIGGGDLLAGRTDACDYPPEIVKKAPVVGGFGTPSLEMLVALNPDLVLDADLEDEAVGRKISELGLRRERVRCRTLGDIPEAVLRVGDLIGMEKSARELAERLRSGISGFRERAAGVTNPPLVYVEIWHDPTMTAGAGTFLSELVRLAGGINMGDAVSNDFFRVSSEWVVSRDPDVVLCLYMASSSRAGKLVLERSGWQNVSAVRDRRVYDSFDNSVILRPGPRVLGGIEALRKCIAPRDVNGKD